MFCVQAEAEAAQARAQQEERLQAAEQRIQELAAGGTPHPPAAAPAGDPLAGILARVETLEKTRSSALAVPAAPAAPAAPSRAASGASREAAEADAAAAAANAEDAEADAAEAEAAKEEGEVRSLTRLLLSTV